MIHLMGLADVAEVVPGDMDELDSIWRTRRAVMHHIGKVSIVTYAQSVYAELSPSLIVGSLNCHIK